MRKPEDITTKQAINMIVAHVAGGLVVLLFILGPWLTPSLVAYGVIGIFVITVLVHMFNN